MRQALICAAVICAFADTASAQDVGSPESTLERIEAPSLGESKYLTPDYIFTVKPAKFYIISFSRFDFKNENGKLNENLSRDFANGSVVLNDTGQAGELRDGTLEARLVGRELIIITPPVQRPAVDNALDTLIILTAKSGETRTVLIKTRPLNYGASITTEFHCEDDCEDVQVSPAIEVSGLSDHYALGDKDLILSFSSGSPFISDASYGFQAESSDVDTNFDTVYPQDISSLVHLSADGPSLTIDAASLRDLNARLPSGPVELYFNLPQDGDLNSVSVQYFNGSATVTGQLVDADGIAITPDLSETGPLEILLSLKHSDYRRIVPIQPDGSFAVDHLADGKTYWFTVSDMRFPNRFLRAVRVPKHAAKASVTLPYYTPDASVAE